MLLYIISSSLVPLVTGTKSVCALGPMPQSQAMQATPRPTSRRRGNRPTSVI